MVVAPPTWVGARLDRNDSPRLRAWQRAAIRHNNLMRIRHARRLALLALAAVATLACDGFIATVEPTPTLISRRESIRQRPMVAVVRGPLVEAIRGSARVEAARRTDLFFKTEGPIASLRVRDGDEVAQGDVLAGLETGRLDSDVAAALEAASSAQLRLDAARQRAANERAAAQQAVASAELAVEVRTTELARLLARATDDQIETLDVDPADYEVEKVVAVDAAEAEAAVFRALRAVADATRVLADLQAAGVPTPTQAMAQAAAELTTLRTDRAAARQEAMEAQREADRLGAPGSTMGTPTDIASANASVEEARRQVAEAMRNQRLLESDGPTAGATARATAQVRLNTAIVEVSAARAALVDAQRKLTDARAAQPNAEAAARIGAVDAIERAKSGLVAKQLELSEALNDLHLTAHRPTPRQRADADAELEIARLSRDDVLRTNSGASDQAKQRAVIAFQIAQRIHAEAIRPATAEEMDAARAGVERRTSELTLVQNELDALLEGQTEAAAIDRLIGEFVVSIELDVAQALADRNIARQALQGTQARLTQLVGSGTVAAAVERETAAILQNRDFSLEAAAANLSVAESRLAAADARLTDVMASASSELQAAIGARAVAAGAEAARLEAHIMRFVGGRSDAEAVEARASAILAAGENAQPSAEAALDAALAEVRAKEARLQDLTNPPTTARLRVALSNLLAAELDAENAHDQLERLRRGESATDFELQILENDLARATIALETLQREQSEHIIVAPFAGVITFTNASPGKTARAFEEVVGLADPAELVVEVQISNEDQAKLAVGQVADVTLDAFPGVTFPATVETIPHSIVSQTGRTVRIPFATLSVDWGDTAVRLGMIARVSITLQTKDDVLKIPITAVKSLNERTFVETVLNEQRRSLPVVTGITSDTEIEVIVGLEEGQTIFASP